MVQEKIALLVDSGTDVPNEWIQKDYFYMIPLKIIYTDGEYTDKVDITAEEIFARLSEEIPSTSLPDGSKMMDVFDQIKADGYTKVLAITISSGLSGTNNAIRLIAEQHPELETYVLDTKNIGIGAGMQAIRAAELLERGMAWSSLIEQLEKEVPQTKVFFNVATLEYLQKGGRIGKVTALLGTALKLNPIISCNEEGVYHTVAKSRGRKKSIEKTLQLIRETVGTHTHFRLAVAHGDALEEAQEVYKKLSLEFPNATEILFGTISPALVVHTGPGLLGVGVQLLS